MWNQKKAGKLSPNSRPPPRQSCPRLGPCLSPCSHLSYTRLLEVSAVCSAMAPGARTQGLLVTLPEYAWLGSPSNLESPWGQLLPSLSLDSDSAPKIARHMSALAFPGSSVTLCWEDLVLLLGQTHLNPSRAVPKVTSTGKPPKGSEAPLGLLWCSQRWAGGRGPWPDLALGTLSS